MVRSILVPLVVLTMAGAVRGEEPDLPTPGSFDSPQGRFRVTLRPIEQRRFTAEEQLRDLDNTDHVRWEVAFASPSTGAEVARTEWTDVYGLNRPTRPSSAGEIDGWLIFSPGEDFVVLPAEGWASAPGTPERTALALAPALGWKRAAFLLDEPVWSDAFVAVGQRHNDCDVGIDAFDGRVGRQRAVIGSESPVGYRIDEVSDRSIRVRSFLDTCAVEAQQRTFVERCLALDLDTLRAVEIACPATNLDETPSASCSIPRKADILTFRSRRSLHIPDGGKSDGFPDLRLPAGGSDR